ncbi:MAG: hypothetical protein RLZZ342_198 [Candidatus Parcubacteria bacterium]|jgi:photosystem II stability/assembly factor-like uncharacterized protein
MIRKSSVFFALILFFSFGAALLYASDGYTASLNTPVSITGPDGVCKKVTNASATGLSEYIPTASAAEWQSFVAHPPVGVTLAGCAFTWTDRTAAGSRGWSSIASSADGTKLVAVALSNAVSNTDYIYTSSNSGATWIARTAAGSRYWDSVASSADGTKLAAVAADGFIYTSSDSGATWTSRVLPGAYDSWGTITSSSDGNKLVVSGGNYYGRYIYTSTNAGASWTQRASAGFHQWTSIASSADGTKLVAQGYDNVAPYGNYLYTSSNSGATWTNRTPVGFTAGWSSLPSGPFLASSADGTKLAVTSGSAPLYTSTDSGATWTARTVSGTVSLSSIAISADGTKLVGAPFNAGYIYTSNDFGATWTQQTAAGSRSWSSVTSSADGTKLGAAAGTPNVGDIWTGVQQ